MAGSNELGICPSPWFGLGNLRRARKDFRCYTQQLCSRYGDAVSVNIFGHQVFLFARPDYAHEILVEKRRSFWKPGNQRKLFGRQQIRASFNMDGEAWVERRKTLSSFYSPQAVESYRTIVSRQIDDVFDDFSAGTIEVGRPLSALSLQAAALALFGSNVSDVAFSYRDHMLKQQAVLSRRIFSRFQLPGWMTPRSTRIVDEATQFFHGVIDRIIADRRVSGKEPKDLLSHLLYHATNENCERLTHEDVRSEILNNFVATSDTMAAAMTWSAYLLAAHPEWQDKIFEECSADVFAADPTKAESSATRVFKEAMRLYPPAVTMTRRAIENVRISSIDIPTGALIYVMVYLIQRDARWFREPEVFAPDRFLARHEKEMPLGSYLPFGLGPQTCIGRTFAMIEGPMVLSELVRRFRLKLPKDRQNVEMETQLSLHPKGGLFLELESRRSAMPDAKSPELVARPDRN